MFKKTLVVAFLLACLGFGCAPVTPKKSPPAPQPGLSPATAAWKNISPGVDRYDCPAVQCGARLIMYRFAKSEFSWSFYADKTPATVEAWAKNMSSIQFMVNGVYFDRDWRPTGYLVSAAVPIQTRQYDLDKSGVIDFSNGVRIIDTATEKVDLKRLTAAAQSFPLIIKNGQPIAAFKDTHAARRSFIGTDVDGNALVGTVPEDTTTFADLSKLLAATGVKWKNVINLDGGTSTGFAARLDGWSETMNSIVQVPNVIGATKIK